MLIRACMLNRSNTVTMFYKFLQLLNNRAYIKLVNYRTLTYSNY